MKGLLPKFHPNIPKKVTTLGQRIIEHCFMAVRACSSTQPNIVLVDGEEEVDLSRLVEDDFRNAEKDQFQLDKHDFRVTHLRVRSSEVSSHRIAYLAKASVLERDAWQGRLGVSPA